MTQPRQETKRPKWRVLIVDDHPIVRQGLKSALERTPDFEVVGEADNGEDTVTAVRLLTPDVVLLDIRLKGTQSGVEVAGILRALSTTLKIAILTNHAQDPYVRAMIKAGVDGYLLKDTPPNQIVESLGMILNGRSVYSESINTSIVTGYLKSEGTGELTAREAEVLQLMSDGISNEEIAQKLGVGVKAINLHLGGIYAKLGVSNRADAIVHAAKRGLVVMEQQKQ